MRMPHSSITIYMLWQRSRLQVAIDSVLKSFCLRFFCSRAHWNDGMDRTGGRCRHGRGGTVCIMESSKVKRIFASKKLMLIIYPPEVSHSPGKNDYPPWNLQFASENGWLEDYTFLLGRWLFRDYVKLHVGNYFDIPSLLFHLPLLYSRWQKESCGLLADACGRQKSAAPGSSAGVGAGLVGHWSALMTNLSALPQQLQKSWLLKKCRNPRKKLKSFLAWQFTLNGMWAAEV